MNCEPSALMASAACFQCMGSVADDVAIYLLCAWANGGAAPDQQGYLLKDDGSYILTDGGDRILIQI